MLNNEIPCPLCMQPINKYGDHATCCTKSGDLIIRHNTLRNLVDSIARDGLLSPILEKQGILGPTTGRRPGDVTIPNWREGDFLAIDVAVTSPLINSSVRIDEPCEEYARTQKHAKYDSRGLTTRSARWCSRLWAPLVRKVRKFYARFSASQQGGWDVSSAPTVAALGRACRVVCSVVSLRRSSTVSTAARMRTVLKTFRSGIWIRGPL